jgi:hypothetical protein
VEAVGVKIGQPDGADGVAPDWRRGDLGGSQGDGSVKRKMKPVTLRLELPKPDKQ